MASNSEYECSAGTARLAGKYLTFRPTSQTQLATIQLVKPEHGRQTTVEVISGGPGWTRTNDLGLIRTAL